MSSGRSDTSFGNLSSPQGGVSSSAAIGGIRGDHSGNTGDNNIYGSSNIIYNYSGTDVSRNEKILRCLYKSSYESHRKRVREPVEGTCAWVTEHPKYKDWLGKKTSGLLWLSADPGCGKSVIASFLVKHLETRTNATICYFFFKDDSEEQNSATFALCALLHQLFVRKNTISRYAGEAFGSKGEKFAEEVDTLWNILVRAVAEEGCGDVVCVVDALDECEEVAQTQLIRLVAGLPTSQHSDIPLKLVVTSRPYHRIERGLGSHAATIRLKGEDEVNSIAADVTRVIDEGIKDLESYWGQPRGLGYLRDLLESSADRTFIWVSLVLDILSESDDDSPEVFTDIVSTAPRDLAELYTKILDRSTQPDKARRILNIVVAAARPLTLREMNVAFKISRDRKTIKDLQDPPVGFGRTLKNLCGHFVRMIDSKIYLVHQTAREFLVKGSSPGQGNWQYTLCQGDSNFILADICISYLSLEDFENDPPGMDGNDLVLRKGVEDCVRKYAFLGYAAMHWGDHFRDLQARQMELFEFTRLICSAGSNRLLTWLQVYWFNSHKWYPFPHHCTHLMAASWLGQGAVVERLLGDGGVIGDKSQLCGSVLNIAALRGDKDITRMLLEKNVEVIIHGKEYNILQVKAPIFLRYPVHN